MTTHESNRGSSLDVLREVVLPRLEGVKKSGSGFSARCPAHDDHRASLTVAEGTDQPVVLTCMAGCSTDDVLNRISLSWEDICTPTQRPSSEWTPAGPATAVYSYVDENNQLLFQVCRTANKEFRQRVPAPAEKSGWAWKLGDTRRVLYRLPQIIEAMRSGREVWVTEGEKDVHTLVAHGIEATCNPGGAGKWRPEYTGFFADAVVTICADRDDPGRAHAQAIKDALLPVAAYVRIVESGAGKDVTDHVQAGLDLNDLSVTFDSDDTEEAPAENENSLFVDVAAILNGGLPEAPPPVLLTRDDGHCLFYAGKVNVLFGDPECGKTWIALAAVTEALNKGLRCVVVDLDHNGASEILTRLIILGAKPVDLSNPDQFRLAEPEDSEELMAVVQALCQWRPAVAVVDSVGELLPILRLSSNSPDDYTSAHRRTLTPLANAGAAVIAIDHLPKADDARSQGQTGTMAKRRSINGVSLRVSVAEPFVPGRGGAASMRVEKDRSGGVRRYCPADGRTPPAGRFVMTAFPDGTTSWRVTTPSLNSPGGGPGDVSAGDLAELDSLVPEPRSKRDVQDRLKWGSDRAMKALARWRELRKQSGDDRFDIDDYA